MLFTTFTALAISAFQGVLVEAQLQQLAQLANPAALTGGLSAAVPAISALAGGNKNTKPIAGTGNGNGKGNANGKGNGNGNAKGNGRGGTRTARNQGGQRGAGGQAPSPSGTKPLPPSEKNPITGTKVFGYGPGTSGSGAAIAKRDASPDPQVKQNTAGTSTAAARPGLLARITRPFRRPRAGAAGAAGAKGKAAN